MSVCKTLVQKRGVGAYYVSVKTFHIVNAHVLKCFTQGPVNARNGRYSFGASLLNHYTDLFPQQT